MNEVIQYFERLEARIATLEEKNAALEEKNTALEEKNAILEGRCAALDTKIAELEAREPEKPETPEIPEIPVAPEIPEIPAAPEKPETPEIPATPEKPEIPEIPVTPEKPVQTSLFDTSVGMAVDDIRKAISLGDRFLFQRELFAGNGEQMQKTLDEINHLASLQEAMEYVRQHLAWDEENTTCKLFANVLKRRF